MVVVVAAVAVAVVIVVIVVAQHVYYAYLSSVLPADDAACRLSYKRLFIGMVFALDPSPTPSPNPLIPLSFPARAIPPFSLVTYTIHQRKGNDRKRRRSGSVLDSLDCDATLSGIGAPPV